MKLSNREQVLYGFLINRGSIGATTMDIQTACNTCAPGSDAADLRKKGVAVKCEYQKRTSTGRKIFRYTIDVVQS